MASKAQYVGIDLGTTTSGLAALREDGQPEIIPNADGERLTPSVVYFDRHEDVKLVGSAARDGGDPVRTVHQIKRHMDNPDYTVEIDGVQWTPTEISALILAKLKRDCAQIIGEIQDVVITVPANFNELARKATIAAGKIAGLNVTRIVNEPTAAALYYAHTRKVSGRVLVYDLGGGTMDVTVLDIEGDKCRILTSEGARRLGGSNFDEAMLEVYAEQYQAQTGAKLYRDERQRRRCIQAAEDAKKMLSKLIHIQDTIGNDQDGIARIDLTRKDFEGRVAGLVTRTVMLIEQALESAALEPSDIDHVLLVGGSTRIPKVREVLKEFFGKNPTSCGNVDESVALGAALFAKRSATIAEVCNHGYGTVALIEDAATGSIELRNSIVIPKNTPIPCSQTQTYVTSEDNESHIEVDVTQGEDHDPRFVDVIGRIVLEVPPGRPAGCRVTVTYSYDENQRVRAIVTDEESGASKEISISYQGAGVLTEDQIERKSAHLTLLRIE